MSPRPQPTDPPRRKYTNRARVVKMHRQGYRFWRIAKDFGLTINQIVKILNEAGVISDGTIEIRTAQGR